MSGVESRLPVIGFADGNEARAARQGWRVCGFADGNEARAARQGSGGERPIAQT